jgi:hypothetical protein
MGLLWKSMAFLSVGKMIGMTSPFILKWVVNRMMATTSGVPISTIGLPMLMSKAPIALTTSIAAVGLWGLSKLVSITLLCY